MEDTIRELEAEIECVAKLVDLYAKLDSATPKRSAKEIALEHAEKMFSSDLSSAFDKPEDVLKYAKDVYQWLIADESKQQ